MMNPEIERKFQLLGGVIPYDPMTEAELVAIEAAIGESLPAEYRKFMKEYGAAEFGELVEFHLLKSFPLFVPRNGASPTYEKGPFSHFYGSSGGNQGLAKRIDAYRGRVPDAVIPIGDDGGGNQICIGIKCNDKGKVYYWDHNHEWDEEDYLEETGEPMPAEVKFQNLYLAADSFEDFIRRLERTVKT